MRRIRISGWALLLASCVSAAGTLSASASEMRAWTNTKGKTIHAAFVKFDKDTVHLKLKNGKAAKVDLAKLSQRDQKYVRQQVVNKDSASTSAKKSPKRASKTPRIVPKIPEWPNDQGDKIPPELAREWVYREPAVIYTNDAYWTPEGKKTWEKLPSQRRPIKFHHGYAVAESRTPSKEGWKRRVGLIDKTGEFVIGGDNPTPLPEGLSDLGPMGDNGLISFQSKVGEIKLWGYMNLKGEVVLKPRWFHAGRFSRGYAPVSLTQTRPIGIAINRFTIMGEFVYVDAKGSLLNDEKWLIAKPFDHAGPALVYPMVEFKNKAYPSLGRNRVWFYLRPSGTTFRIDDKVKRDYSYRDGRLVTPLKIFDTTGKAIFTAPENYRIVDAQDESDVCVLRPLLPNLPSRLVQRSTGQCYGPPLMLKTIWGFKEGMARFEDMHGGWGFIDRTGKIAIPASFNNSISDFNSGMFKFRAKGKTNYIYLDRKGSVVLFR